ncbi:MULTISPECIES: Shedu immune nuclease family protein [Vibrio]|uniref:Shedu immune nuclease family protein n=1 Tax=Vibrio TaxID=662 RepID=UPI00186A0C85|nr:MULTISPECIES: Shedu immune nuclease family protein [Vibrio]MBE4517058.1 DUF4263 domain-containing protein [Vibrio parahaemolyticus]USD33696.1 DUF4263 domain-containing protein [Vibrio sp. SCSIO 43186]USD46767.1 DUF4263 domain-containing protein [Vibrio sp. SCSIO 43145]USD70820.1 DUF4263 domain-containing protein [Vibrio sp. SCSIO 43139]USD95733.1 hypothetical protein CTT30_06330 [Vibrio coralliilyticus]
MKRNVISIEKKKKLVAESGSQCSFPGCGQNLSVDGETFIGEVAFIESFMPNGPRHNPNIGFPGYLREDNYMLLCPSHHRLIDLQPELYSAKWLKEAKLKHLDRIKSFLEYEKIPAPELDEKVELSLREAIALWDSNHLNSSEEFWQKLFERCPSVLSQIFPQSLIQIGSRCYLGGKSLLNKGGSIVDFIYANKSTSNVVLVEIKTPRTRTLGNKYRNGAYTISSDLSGSIVQVLNYKDKVLKEYYKLNAETSDIDFSAFNPRCIVVIGNIQREMENPEMFKSFELFRNTLAGVEVVTYDELFQKSKDVLEICS